MTYDYYVGSNKSGSHAMQNRQAGFTLVEIAIVLVIIGLMLGGVLKGQELINGAKVKNLINDFRTTSTLVYGYQDRFKNFPGDQTQTQLDSAFGSNNSSACTPAAAGLCATNNGRLDGNWNATDIKSETFAFWQHVRLANLATGTTNTADTNYLPRNADGGQIGIESGISSTGTGAPLIAGMRGAYYICSNNILGRYVKQIDSTMDDGDTASGAVRAIASTAERGDTATATTAIQDGQQYIVCAAF
jgi:prepilin-type N-terminal cleavage/methylation domain-containing protein